MTDTPRITDDGPLTPDELAFIRQCVDLNPGGYTMEFRALLATIDEGGTLTRCPLEGVHEHAFRGPHVFREWEPPTGPSAAGPRDTVYRDLERLGLPQRAEAAAGPRERAATYMSREMRREVEARAAGPRDERLRRALEQIRSYVFTTGDVTALGRSRLLGAIDAALAKASE